MPSRELTSADLFHCTLCGDCCRGFGGTYVSRRDIAAIAAFLDIAPAELVERCCQRSGGRYLLSQRSDGYCVFWDRGCRIHPVKPRMCRRWPFIEGVVTEPSNWTILAAGCPGMRTDVTLDQVRDCVKRVLASEAPERK